MSARFLKSVGVAFVTFVWMGCPKTPPPPAEPQGAVKWTKDKADQAERQQERAAQSASLGE